MSDDLTIENLNEIVDNLPEPTGVCLHDPDPVAHSTPMSEDGKCPKCKGKIEWGYGLAGGGCGSYQYCTEEKGPCDFFAKEQDPINE